MDQHLNCEHFGPCGGCVFDSDLGSFPLVKEAKAYFADKKIFETPVHYFGAHGWRTRAKLAVRGSALSPTIGLFKKNSHSVLPIPHCRVHHPSINAAVEIVKRWIIETEILPYNETNNTGLLRYIQCTVERSTGKIQLVLVCNGIITKEKIHKLWESSPLWHSIWTNQNDRIDNIIFGEEWTLIFGPEWLWETISGVDCCFHPAGFLQANLSAFEALLKQLGSWVSSEKRVVEYYAGAGIIGLSLASKGCQVECFELNAACEASFDEAKKRLNKGSITWTCCATDKALSALDSDTGKDVTIVVDPPRKGLDKKTLSAFGKAHKGTELIYVSCGWDSCKRDIDFLVESGWKLHHGEIYIFFPGSQHIETLCLLEKI